MPAPARLYPRSNQPPTPLASVPHWSRPCLRAQRLHRCVRVWDTRRAGLLWGRGLCSSARLPRRGPPGPDNACRPRLANLQLTQTPLTAAHCRKEPPCLSRRHRLTAGSRSRRAPPSVRAHPPAHSNEGPHTRHLGRTLLHCGGEHGPHQPALPHGVHPPCRRTGPPPPAAHPSSHLDPPLPTSCPRSLPPLAPPSACASRTAPAAAGPWPPGWTLWSWQQAPCRRCAPPLPSAARPHAAAPGRPSSATARSRAAAGR